MSYTKFAFPLLLLATAMPAAATIINIDPSGSGSSQSNYSFTVNTGNSDVNTFSTPVYEIDGSPLSSGANQLGAVTLTYNGTSDVLTITTTGGGTGIYSNITAGTTLLTFNFSAPLTVSSTSGASSLMVPRTTSVSGNTLFVTDLGINASLANALEINTLGINGNVSSGTFTTSSTVFLVTTPEPATLLLFGSGLGLAGFLGRRRRKS